MKSRSLRPKLHSVVPKVQAASTALLYRASENNVVWIAQPTTIPWVNCVVEALLVEMLAQRRRDALVGRISRRRASAAHNGAAYLRVSLRIQGGRLERPTGDVGIVFQ